MSRIFLAPMLRDTQLIQDNYSSLWHNECSRAISATAKELAGTWHWTSCRSWSINSVHV